MFKLTMEPTMDYPELVDFFIANELEFDENEVEENEYVAAYKVIHGDALVGGVCLTIHEGEYVIDGIAVDPLYRKMKLGKILLEKVIERVLELGGDHIILVARAPGFFKKFGFEPVPEEAQPDYFDCKTCPQNGIKCFPEVLKLQLK